MALRSAALRVAARARCAASAAPAAPPRAHAAQPAPAARRFAAAAGSRVLEVKTDAEYAAALSSAQGARTQRVGALRMHSASVRHLTWRHARLRFAGAQAWWLWTSPPRGVAHVRQRRSRRLRVCDKRQALLTHHRLVCVVVRRHARATRQADGARL
jgi:hypothetical protein